MKDEVGCVIKEEVEAGEKRRRGRKKQRRGKSDGVRPGISKLVRHRDWPVR